MNWLAIRDAYRKTTGSSDDAQTLEWTHIGDGYRAVASALDIPEIYVPNALVPTIPGTDYVEPDCDIYSVTSVTVKSTGRKLDREPNGWRGRARYYEVGEERPPYGPQSWWVRMGNRIYLRDCPDLAEAADTLIFAFKSHTPELSDDLLDSNPATPPQFNLPIIQLAAASFFKLHPPKLADGSPDYMRARDLESTARQRLPRPSVDPVAEEARDQRHYIRQMGYRFDLRGR